MKHRQKKYLVACIAVALCAVGSTSGYAQVRRYQPSRPTVSPYMNLFRDQTGPLPNYQALVRPLQLQDETNRLQEQSIQRNAQQTQQRQTELYSLQQQQAAQLQMSPTGKGSWFARPSQRNQFLNTSRFYSQSGSAAVQRTPAR